MHEHNEHNINTDSLYIPEMFSITEDVKLFVARLSVQVYIVPLSCSCTLFTCKPTICDG